MYFEPTRDGEKRLGRRLSVTIPNVPQRTSYRGRWTRPGYNTMGNFLNAPTLGKQLILFL